MSKKCSMIVCVLVVLFCFNAQVESKPVKGYNSYIELLPGGKQTQMINFDVINRGQSQVIKIEKEKRSREIKFNRPVDVFDLSSKYFMIAFDISYKPSGNSRFSANPAIFSLIFEKNGTTSLKKYAGSYIKWIGAHDIENYGSSGIPEFCEYFRRTGVEDCIPDQLNVEKKSEARLQSKKKSSAKTQMNEPTLVRKKEFDRVITEKENKIEKLSFIIDRQNETMTLLTGRIKSLENKEAVSPSSNDAKDNIVTAGEINILKERLTSLQKELAAQSLYTKELEKEVLSFTSLLNGVTRSNNDLIFNGINLQIVNGLGSTDGQVNGTGNLIVGYNEKKPGENLKTGSHKIIAPDLEMISHKIKTIPESSEKGESVKSSGLCFIESVFFD